MEPVAAPDFELPGLDGKQHRLSEYAHRKVLLTFWATWCPPCRGELTELTELGPELRKSGVEIVSVSVDDPGDRDKVRRFAKELALAFPVLFADDKAVAVYSILNRYLFDRRRDLGIPTSFLIDGAGNVVKVYVGATPVSAMLVDSRTMRGPASPFKGLRFTAPPQRNYLDLATAFAERGFEQQAATLFQAAVRAGRQDPQLLTNMAGLLIERGDLQQAERLLRQTLAEVPTQQEARINLGTLLVRQGRMKEAIPHLRSAMEVYPDDPQILSSLGTALFQTAEMSAARDLFARAVKLQPDSADHHYNLGTALAASGDHELALKAFENSRRLGKNTTELHNSLGIVYMQTGDADAALRAFKQALGVNPKDVNSRLNLAVYYSKTAQPAAARELLNKLLQEQPELESARRLLEVLR